MKLTLEATSDVVKVNGVECRVFRGTTGRDGIEVIATVTGIEPVHDQDRKRFSLEWWTAPCPHPASLRKVLAEMGTATR